MAKINVLSFEIANLIAAGEVVERPSSVLKELIENSIDSGATSIIAEIKRGGVALIRVTDNGCGIDKDDLPIALQRHATSKIRTKEDIDSIVTLGFRGEALAAISSVSEMTIISKTKDAPAATMLTASAGKVVDISEVGASDGTTVVVENLFGNVPARRKFLKKDATEAMNVAALVEKVALSHPEISIQLLIDGEERFKTQGDGDLYNTIYAVLGKDFASKIIRVEGTASGVKVHGYIGRSDNARKNRNLQNFFINGRYVKTMTAMAAIEKAYTSYIAPECFPTCVLFIEINPSLVDVNIHPAKLEVKFTDERTVFEAVYYSVKNALEDNETRPEMTLGATRGNDRNALGAFVPVGQSTKGEQIRISTPVSMPSGNYQKEKEIRSTSSYSEAKGVGDRPVAFSSGSARGMNYDYLNSPSKSEISPKDSVELLKRYGQAKVESVSVNNSLKVDAFAPVIEEKIPEHKIIGEAFDCYVMVEYEGALLVIDKHAAHERIIFEELNKNRKKDGRVSYQSLILPLTVLMNPEELNALSEFKVDIESVGFEYSVNEKSVDIYSIPDAISVKDAESLIVDMASDLVSGAANPLLNEDIRREKALYQIACKAAIKGGRVYDRSIIEWLVGKVLMLPDITVCPHGRPIAYKLTKTELDRQFDRIK